MAKPGAKKDPIIRIQVANLMAQGRSPREIADELGYSVQRIYTLRRELLQKQDAVSVVDAVDAAG